MLTDADLARMRGAQESIMTDTCQVQRATLMPDGAGGQIESWGAVATVSCRVAPSGNLPQERAIAERLSSVSTWTITLPVGTDVQPADRLVVGSRTFEVVEALARSLETARRVICSEVA